MKIKNTVYSQIAEAIKLASYNIFDYKRISLILFDNTIEYLLKVQVLDLQPYFAIKHNIIVKELKGKKHEDFSEILNRFENLTKYAKKFNIISEKDKPILDYCHKARNNVYHNFFENERITDCCVSILSEFLCKNVEKLLEIWDREWSETLSRNQNKIFEIANLKSYKDALSNLHSYHSTNIKPSYVFSQILIDELTELLEFQESSANEDWEEFNTILREQYFWDIIYKEERKKNNKIDLHLFASDFKKKWKNLNQKDIDKYKQQSNTLKKISTNDAFEKFINIKNKLTPFYLGMKYYISEQEYNADCNE